MSKEKDEKLEELEKQITIERLMQAPPTIKVSFGMSEGKFLNRDELIQEVKKDSDMGKRIINVQLEYLRAFKREIVVGE